VKGQNYTNCDLYVTKFERSGEGGNDFTWSKLENLGPNINTPDGWEAQPTLSADGNTLFYTVARPSSRDNDIYIVTRGADGKWGKARPFDEINTAGKDKSPFLHQDSETLYFVSTCTRERKGVGGLDIFYIRQVDGVWSEPINIGYPINSEADELGIFVSTDGELAYFSSRFGGDWNIYSFELYEEARPTGVMIVKGELTDEEGDPVSDATIEVSYQGSDEITKFKVNGDDGKYAAVVKIPKGESKDVLITVKKEGYAFDSKLITGEKVNELASVTESDEKPEKEVNQVEKTVQEIAAASEAQEKKEAKELKEIEKDEKPTELVENAEEKEVLVDEKVIEANETLVASDTPAIKDVSIRNNDLKVRALKVGEAYTINDILYATNDYSLNENSKFILKGFAHFLDENPKVKVAIQGYTDDIGEDETNLTLSGNRANGVKEFLIGLGIDKIRLDADGFGESQPKFPNDSAENRAKNRRTDFVILAF
jgi:outer membrane protein OmpA-like peptidoglycan-associated protein/Tol biopolymer transport system component